MIIAIDGPAASGKGTLARRLAAELNLAYLDTGSLYRAVGLALLRQGEDPHDAAAADRVSRELDMALLNSPDLRKEGVGEAASIVAAQSRVRQNLLAFQRHFASHPPGDKDGAILDGRDIGTVVCPNADIKLFVCASDAVRAQRRTWELREKGEDVSFESILDQLRTRDQRDLSRTDAPLQPADDAILLDTTELDIEAAFERAIRLIKGPFTG